MSTGVSHHRTLWEEGRKPARLVAVAAAALLLIVVLLDVVAFRDLTLFSDIAFVMVCAAAALAVRPREFFVIGVFPPLLMAGTIAVLALLARGTVADTADGFLQAVVSGLAHHAGALILSYGLTLAILALRQFAIRNSGTIRANSRPAAGSPAPRADES